MEKKKVRRYSLWAMYVAIWLVFRNFPTFTERFYSNGIYPYIAKLLHLAFGWVPFSFGDILYTLFIIGLLGAIIKHFRKVWQKPLWLLDKIVAKIITIIVAFFFLWGFNYFRIPLAQQLNVNTKYSAEQLYKATESCIIRANALHLRLADTDSSKVTLPFSNREIYRIAAESYPLNITNITDFTAIKSVKSSVYSKLLTYMGYSGYLNPFTNEAQVNNLMVGYLAAMKADNPYFKYSAELFALRCFLNEVAVLSPEKYDELQAQVRKGIFENYKEVRLFWQQYKNKAEPIFKSSYDVFLKANKQVAGINSYDLVTGLLIPHYVENTD